LHVEPPGFSSWHRVVRALKVRYDCGFENDLATPVREITARHGVDRRSLFAAVRRDAIARDATSRIRRDSCRRPYTNQGCACQHTAVHDHDAAPMLDLSCATSPTGGKRGKHIAILQMVQDANRKFRKSGIELRG
jgi:hypothetical protein